MKILSILLLSSCFAFSAPCTPTIGTESFTNNLGTLVNNQPSPQSAILECYEFEILSDGNVTIESDGVRAILSSDGLVTEFRIKSSDNSAFQLESFGYRKQSSSYDGDMTITGYKDGTIVSGATEVVTVGGFSDQIADVSANSDFDNIDEFRLTFSNNTASGIFWITEITITEAVSIVNPLIYKLAAEATGSESATFYADIADGGASTTYTFDYGTASGDYSLSYSNTIAGNSATINVGFEDTENLTANTQYYVRASATNSVTWTESEEISFWTLADEPAAHSTLAQIGEEDNTIELSFDAFSGITNANGYLIIRSNSTIGEDDLPVDGNSYNVDDIFGNSTVVAKITDNTATSHTFNNLSKEQSWQFALVPYNEGDNVATTNYKTDNVPTISGYTIPTLGEWGMIAFTLLMGIGGVWYARRKA